LRRHRSEVSVELRKAKKDDQLTKRRNMDDDNEPGSPLQDKNAQASVISVLKLLKIAFMQFSDVALLIRTINGRNMAIVI